VVDGRREESAPRLSFVSEGRRSSWKGKDVVFSKIFSDDQWYLQRRRICFSNCTKKEAKNEASFPSSIFNDKPDTITDLEVGNSSFTNLQFPLSCSADVCQKKQRKKDEDQSSRREIRRVAPSVETDLSSFRLFKPVIFSALKPLFAYG